MCKSMPAWPQNGADLARCADSSLRFAIHMSNPQACRQRNNGHTLLTTLRCRGTTFTTALHNHHAASLLVQQLTKLQCSMNVECQSTTRLTRLNLAAALSSIHNI